MNFTRAADYRPGDSRPARGATLLISIACGGGLRPSLVWHQVCFSTESSRKPRSSARKQTPPPPTRGRSLAKNQPPHQPFPSPRSPQRAADRQRAVRPIAGRQFRRRAGIAQRRRFGRGVRGRVRHRPHRRGRSDRRPGADLLDADGRDTHAPLQRRVGHRQAHQAGAAQLPLQHVGHRLRPASGGRHVGEHPRQPAASGPHDRGLGDQSAGEGAAAEGHGPEPANAARSDAAEQAGLRFGHFAPSARPNCAARPGGGC